jgi:N-acetylglucosamine kinase-like BadF-type ATPase
LLADEGGGYWLGVQAMRLAVAAYDGREPATALRESIRVHLGLANMPEIMHRLHIVGLSRTETAALAPLVLEAARAGDAAALGLLRRGGEELARCVDAVAQRLSLAAGPCELALAGGLFQAGEIVIAPLRAAVTARLPKCRLTPAELPPVLGACLLALETAGLPADADRVVALRASARAHGL